HEQRRAACTLAGRLQRHHLRVRSALPLVPPLAHDRPVADDDGAHDWVRVGRAPPALGQLERTLEAHDSVWTSRRYVRVRSSLPKMAEPATRRSAPASWTARMLSAPTPPSTWTCLLGGRTER